MNSKSFVRISSVLSTEYRPAAAETPARAIQPMVGFLGIDLIGLPSGRRCVRWVYLNRFICPTIKAVVYHSLLHCTLLVSSIKYSSVYEYLRRTTHENNIFGRQPRANQNFKRVATERSQ